jgi:tetratricopeptide (TPR) repeat protein
MAIVADIQKRLGPSSAQTTGGKPNQESNTPPADIPAEQLQQLQAFIAGLRPAIADAYNNLGAISAGEGDFARAVTLFRDAAQWDPSLEGIDRNIGRAALLAGQYEQAVPPLSRYLKEHPQDVSARSVLALALFHLNEYQKVVEVLSPIANAVQADPQLANAYAVSLSKTKQK